MGTPTVARLSLWGLGVLLFLALLEGGLCGLQSTWEGSPGTALLQPSKGGLGVTSG